MPSIPQSLSDLKTSVPVPSGATTAAATTALSATRLPGAAAKAKPLTAKQELALTALMTAPTQEAAAKSAGISTITLWRYMKQAEFRDAYEAARREVAGETVTELQRSSLNAVKTLNAISMNNEAAVTARVSAAKAILDMSFRAAEVADFKARLESLEEVNRYLED